MSLKFGTSWTLLPWNVSRSPWLLGQMKTSLVRSCVLSSRNSDDVTLLLPTGLGAPAEGGNDSGVILPVVSAVTVPCVVRKYVRGKFPLFSFAYIWMPWP